MRRILLNIILALGLTLPILAGPTAAYACPSGAKGEALQGINQNGCSDSGVNGAIHGAVVILSLVVGAVAVIMVILAGFKYITSGGDTNKVANAKSTLVYALIGVVVAAVAQFLVHFVLFHTNKAVG